MAKTYRNNAKRLSKYVYDTKTGQTSSMNDSSYNKINEQYLANARKKEKQESWFEMPDENLGTLGNLFVSGVEGLGQVGNAILGSFEGADDFRRNRIADVQELFGHTAAAEKTRRQAEQEWSAPIIGKYGKELQEATEGLDEYSVFGGKADAVFQGVGSSILAQGLAVPGQMAGGLLGFGAKGMEALGSVTSLGNMGVSAAGGNETQARIELREQYPDMSTEEINRRARVYGAITGTGEVLSEMMFGGISKASNTLGIGKGVFDSFDDAIAQGLTKHIENKILKTLIQSGIKASGEGVEEIVSGLFEIAGKKLALMDDTDIMTMLQDESLLDSFLSGTLSAAITQAPGVVTNIQNTNNGIYRDYVSGLSENEQKVVDAVTEARIGEEEKTAKERNEIRNEVKEQLLNGRLSISEINKSLKEEIQGSPADVYLHNISRNESSQFDVLEEERNKVKTKNQENLLKEVSELKSLNNAQEMHDIYNTLNAIQGVNDSIQYHLTTTEGLYEMGLLEKNAKGEYTLKGEKYIPRGITKDGNNIYVNADVGAKSGTQAMYHEMFEAFKSTSPEEYNQFKQMVRDIVGEDIIQSEIEEYRKMYNMKENSEGLTNDVEDEIINDKFGEIAESEEFLRKISENRTLLQKFMDKIKEFIKYLKGTQQEKSLIKLKQNLEKKFNELYKGTQFKSTKGTNYSIVGLNNIDKTLKRQDLTEQQRTLLEKMKSNYKEALNKDGKVDNEQIRKDTGWYKDKNGDWKLEITDKYSKMKMLPKQNGSYTLEELLDHKLLYDIEPRLKNLKVKFTDLGTTGTYFEIPFGIAKTIYLDNKLINKGKEAIKNVLIHEIQHYNQATNKFERGRRAGETLEDVYKYVNSLGEIEAKDVQLRANMTQEELRNIAPESSKENPVHPMKEQLINQRKNKLAKQQGTQYNKANRGVSNEEIEETTKEAQNKNNQEIWNGLEGNTSFSNDIKYSLTDNQGRQLSEQQQEYFKDSKVRDDEGNLLTMYHGSQNDFTIFNRTFGGWYGDGYYFTDSKESGVDYAKGLRDDKGKLYETYLDIKNPYIPVGDTVNKDGSITFAPSFREQFENTFKDDLPNNWNELRRTEQDNLVQKILKKNGYDGINNGDVWVAFDSNQIKNADNTNPTSNPDIRYSLTVSEANTGTDNEGHKLTKGQQDYFKESKATDENGNLIEVYHTTTGYTHQFNEFNPLGDNFYKFGNTTVNYYTDSKEMSSSYGYNSIAPVTQRIESMDDVNKVIGDRFKVEENNGQYDLYDSYDESVIKTYEDVIKLFNQEEQDILNKTFNKSRSEVRDMLNNNEEQFDFYDKTRTKWFNTFAELEDTSKMTAGDVRKTSDEIIDNYLNDKKQTPIKTFKDAQDLYRNITETVSPYEHYQYEGYVNITNPYIIDAEGQYWNRIQNPDALEYKKQIKEKWDVPERQLDRLEGDTLKELNRDMSKLGWQIKEDQYGDLGLFSRDSELAIDLLNVNDVLQEIRTDLDNDLKTPLTTNDIVFQALNENNFGANYDGVIIRNVIDYGEHVSGEATPSDVYVTFDSNQFKAVDNTNPTSDADIRYSLNKDAIRDLTTPTGETVSMLEANLENDEYQVKNYLTRHTKLVENYMRDNNIDIAPVMKSTELEKFSQNYKDFVIKNDLTVEKLGNNEKLLNEYLDNMRKGMLEDLPDNVVNNIIDKQQEMYDYVKEIGTIPTPLKRYDREFDLIKNNTAEIVDEWETEKKIQKEVTNSPEFQKYLDDIVKPLFQREFHTTEEIMEEAEYNHGITDNYEVGAYMTTNGNLLDFGDSGYRDDHRTIDAFGLDMNEFMEEGAIRMKPEAPGFEMAIEPTAEQYDKLYDYIEYLKAKDGEIHADNSYIDVDVDVPGTNSYNTAQYKMATPTNKIINDIKEYWRTGSFPKQSEYADFYYSLTRTENQKYNGIAPYNDVKFGQQVQEAVAPLQEQVKELTDTVKELKETIAPTNDLDNLEINYEPFMDMINGLGENKNIREQQAAKVDTKQMNRINKQRNTSNALNFLKRAFVNEFATVDEFAKTHNAPQIKYKADTYNNYQPIAQSNIESAQTDINGKEIGRGLKSIFNEARHLGLEEALNDYLIQWSNTDRQYQGKGTEYSLEDSKKLIKKYDEKYPELKRLARDVWQYSRNARHNMRDAGYISEDLSNKLGHMYPHYVPFVSDNIEQYYVDSKEIKPKSTIKRAKGGAETGMLLPVEEALTRYTYNQFNTVFSNDLYRDIIKASNDVVQIGGDTRNNYVDMADNLFMDENGYYITAYENGEPITGRISEDMYKTLSRQMNKTIKDVEQKLSFVTKPLQKLSRVRRDILTKYSPTFPVKNATKDVQDAEFNSKYTLDFNKEYANPVNWYELATNKGDAQQFRSLYGGGLEMGMFNVDSGLYDAKKSLKNFNFLKGIENVNELIELAPRYAEFKASLKNGATIQEAMYNAREVTTNFSRGGVITKALNRNGFTFLNASVQGFDKFIRNFSGENGAKGIANSLLKAAMFGVVPAVFNELVFGWGDDKDEDYEALPNYIKDNYYLIKTGDGEFIRIPKGRMLSVFGSAARRTLESVQGEDEAFKGYLSSVNNQIGINNPEENNIFAPLIQAFGSKNGNAWYGGDIVPTRLQDKPTGEQYDESTDKLSIWLGEKTGISPYKLNYVLDQYTGGIGDLILPYMTEESNTSAEGIGRALAPIKDQFVVDSTYDNKYVSNFYSKREEITTKANGSKATDEDQLQKKYLDSISKQMTELYAEKREIQSDPDLSKTEKYEKATEIKKEINRLAKEGLENYQDISKDGDYASVGDNDYQKTEDGWKKVSSKGSDDMNLMGLNNKEKSQYTKTQTELNNIKNKYKGSSSEADSINKRTEIINTITTSNLSDDAKVQLYKDYYSDNMIDDYVTMGMNVDSYLNYKKQNFTADKYANGQSISGSKKQKVFDYIESMNIPYEQKLILAKEQYNSWNDGNAEIIQYLNNNKNIDYQTMEDILKHLGFKVDANGNISW